MRNIIFGIILLNLVLGCKNSNEKPKTELKKNIVSEISETELKGKSESRILGNVYGNKKLYLTAMFNECGEWGGHRENLIIYRKNNILFADFTKDSVNCKTTTFEKSPIEVIDIVENKTFELDNNGKEKISEYLNKLLTISLNDPELYPKYCYYNVISSDSTLILKYIHPGNKWKEFEKLKSELIK